MKNMSNPNDGPAEQTREGGVSDLPDLIARLEKATEPDRRLDFDIWVTHTKPSGFPAAGEPERTRTAWFECWKNKDGFPAYTKSADDALTLVPERWSKDIWIKRHGGHHWSCTLHIPSYQQDGRHKELAIAISIAALRAKFNEGK